MICQIIARFLLILLIMVVIKNKANGKDMKFCYDETDFKIYKNFIQVIDVPLGSSIKLECHFCNDQDDYQAKIWFFRKRGNVSKKQELISDVFSDNKDNIIDISPTHTLHLKYFKNNASGFYLCSYFDREEALFTYILDGVYDVTTTPRVGTISEWYEFKKNIIDPTNIQHSKEFLIFPFQIDFFWGKWGFCKSDGHDFVRQRTGKCRVRPMKLKIRQMISSAKYVNDGLFIYLLDSYTVSCRSIELGSFYPEISHVIRNIPEFTITEFCNVSKPGNKVKKDKTENYFKYNVTKHVEENSHLILTCPEVFVKSEINWYKENCLLNSSYRNNMAQSLTEPHLTIDADNSVHILQATKADEGIYTCTVDGRNMQIFHVKVVTKRKLLNQDFIRYSMYLGFVLSLTVTCYCAGICVAWQKRTSFADPLNLMKNKYSCTGDDHEPLLYDLK